MVWINSSNQTRQTGRSQKKSSSAGASGHDSGALRKKSHTRVSTISGGIAIQLFCAIAAKCTTSHLFCKISSLVLKVIWHCWWLLGRKVARNLDGLHHVLRLSLCLFCSCNRCALCLQNILHGLETCARGRLDPVH